LRISLKKPDAKQPESGLAIVNQPGVLHNLMIHRASYTLDDYQKEIESTHDCDSEHQWWCYAKNTMVGIVGIWQIRDYFREELVCADVEPEEYRDLIGTGGYIYYVVDCHYQRQGIARVAVTAAIDFAFKRKGLGHLLIEILCENEPSVRLATQLGFRCYGVNPEGYREVQEGVEKHFGVWYGILRREAWLARQG
jgi:RimJ/RimL family protein N-acetyltransferase